MTTIAQGISKTVAIVAQSGLGVPGSTGSTYKRRTSSVWQAPTDTFENNEIVSHQQSTGVTYGLKKANGKIDGLLSAGSYAPDFAALLRKVFTATAAITAASITIAGSGPTWTVTRAAGSFLTDGVKIGDVIRLSVGTLNAANISKNLMIVGLTATVATVIVLNGTVLVAEGPIASTTVTVIGKKTLAPMTGHTNTYFSVEEWYSNISKSELFTDAQPSACAIGLPATGNATVSFDWVALARTLGGSQVLTTPAAAPTTAVLTAVNGAVIVNGNEVTNITGATLNIDGTVAPLDAVLGANASPDIQRGRIMVTGQFTALFDGTTIQALYAGQTPTSLVLAMTADQTAASDFVAFSLGRIKLTGDAPDDGEKAIVRTYPFTAEININGGAALANDQTILSIQDSAAP